MLSLHEKKNSFNPSADIYLGVCAYNEEKNIGLLLENLTTSQNLPATCNVLIVCSGCTDSTPRIVEQFQKLNSHIKLITEAERGGKARALNNIFSRASQSEMLILTNADAVPVPGSIMMLTEALRDKTIGAVSGRPVPLSSSPSLSSKVVRIIWELHHEISIRESVKLSGELCVIRPFLVKRIPTNLATDEPYIEMLIRRQGYRIGYVPEAVVGIRCPEKLREVFKHRRRIWAGHLQIKQMAGFAVSTSDFRKILPTLVKSLRLHKGELHALALLVLIDSFAYLLARRDVSIGKVPFVWEMLKSTKT
ncbi:MAG: glycosyltransferase [Candidatus Bathyarchaeia archaeon]